MVVNKKMSVNFTYVKNEQGEFVCPECNVVKKRQNSMHYHMKKHLEELNHVCKACKKGFLQKQTLDLHIRSKHPELVETQEKKKFTCPIDDCEFTALTKGNCVIHCLRAHFKEEIKLHMSTDAETKIITCNQCDVEFSSSCSFYYHCKTCITFSPSEKAKKLKALMG